MLDKITARKFNARIDEIETTVYRQRAPLPPLRQAPATAEQTPGRLGVVGPELPVGASWGGPGIVASLHGHIAIPAAWGGEAVVLLARLAEYKRLLTDDGNDMFQLGGPEALAYLDGTPFAGIDRFHSALQLAARARGDERWDLTIEAYSGRYQGQHTLQQYELAVRDPVADALASDLRAAYDALLLLESQGSDAALLARALDAALAEIDFRVRGSSDYYASLAPAQAAFSAVLADYRHGKRPRVVATGHAHIDVAWLWPLAQTRRKVARTFSTVLRLMEQYPEFHFTQSQPQLYRYLMEDEPALYEQVRQRVQEGRWEPTGGMWLEADTNLPNGESLVRQFVYGQRFFEEQFGRRSTLLWLPDVFGYSWALPQLMRGAGITHFMTSKISWNQYNRFPYDTFRWRGIDGTEVVTHFITTPSAGHSTYTYNGLLTPNEVHGTYQAYHQQSINDRLLYLFGHGDGGGGPTREMLERGRRVGGLPGMPEFEQGSAEAFFHDLAARVLDGSTIERTPVWEGELYLELHRGTYTSQGRTKYAHRRAEVRLHEAECWQALAASGDARLDADLDDTWRLLLLQQFHDILPGSSIPEVYEDALRDLAVVQARATAARDAALEQLEASLSGSGPALLVFNSTTWRRCDPVEWFTDLKEGEPAPSIRAGEQQLTVQSVEGTEGESRRLLVGPPASGVAALGYSRWELGGAGCGASRPDHGEIVATETLLESRFYRLELDERGEIASLRDKRVDRVAGGREIVLDGAVANRLIAFEDRPLDYDAWDIDLFYQEKPYVLDALDDLRVVERGPLRAGVELRRRFVDSTVTQRIYIYRDSPRIDFVTDINWRQHQVLLKAAFPVAIHAGRATYEIQFGAVERSTHWNTSWDRARFEVCAQRWADLSEGDYGVALLNDGKYGYDIRGNVMRLTLLKSGIMPDPEADQGAHHFTYSLLPHAGDWRSGQVMAHATALNLPLVARHAPGKASAAGTDPAIEYSFVVADREGLVIDTLKPAVDGRGVVLRLYEAHGTRGAATLSFARTYSRVEECNLLEDHIGDVEQVGPRQARLQVRPFEIKTLRLVP